MSRKQEVFDFDFRLLLARALAGTHRYYAKLAHCPALRAP